MKFDQKIEKKSSEDNKVEEILKTLSVEGKDVNFDLEGKKYSFKYEYADTGEPGGGVDIYELLINKESVNESDERFIEVKKLFEKVYYIRARFEAP
ncbi:hypothetical protein COY33_01695 [candidate division WWE3 bacterium CG_4_10_14_0_2_um_filter_42_7]|uniref:Uncharacterized protein n=1 Tax=candidate division WWE3 bacterium CG_4_10_14_0_2_um_filter_42_7 TaxID=1975073 RepID=A0A2M7TD38_UNCKA|nr:MAG: hypothetical protein COX43_02285 [Parcubacteria group bacterium CG23_combo_of_CG06-09_8_20_14_all_35_9]PIZ43320.1 MAG: hypothetical protein COY33_01695 [candidate division WWE3 bacterium CG_4_10_14_0_2_um_filter_42_7]